MMLGGNSPRFPWETPNQTLENLVAQMEAPPSTWPHACDDDEQ
jgi:hypothetical protein